MKHIFYTLSGTPITVIALTREKACHILDAMGLDLRKIRAG